MKQCLLLTYYRRHSLLHFLFLCSLGLTQQSADSNRIDATRCMSKQTNKQQHLQTDQYDSALVEITIIIMCVTIFVFLSPEANSWQLCHKWHIARQATDRFSLASVSKVTMQIHMLYTSKQLEVSMDKGELEWENGGNFEYSILCMLIYVVCLYLIQCHCYIISSYICVCVVVSTNNSWWQRWWPWTKYVIG